MALLGRDTSVCLAGAITHPAPAMEGGAPRRRVPGAALSHYPPVFSPDSGLAELAPPRGSDEPYRFRSWRAELRDAVFRARRFLIIHPRSPPIPVSQSSPLHAGEMNHTALWRYPGKRPRKITAPTRSGRPTGRVDDGSGCARRGGCRWCRIRPSARARRRGGWPVARARPDADSRGGCICRREE